MKLLSATVGAGAFFASAIAYTVHNGAAPADGKLIGAAPNSRIRSQLQREGLPD